VTDRELLVRVGEGDRAAFDVLFQRYERRVRGRVFRMVRDAAAAEDTVQEVFYRVWTRATTFTGDGEVGGWIHRIACNQALNHIRAEGRKHEVPLESVSDDEEESGDAVRRVLESALPGPEAETERRQLQGLIRNLIAELPDSKRDVIRLVHGKEMSVEQTAAALGVPAGTVKSRLHYGRMALERRLRQFMEE
jgi:RNA polymerase sigma-70 factor (ECF subfamily)